MPIIMQKLQKQTSPVQQDTRTPIEILLKIDNDGMTTATQLYDFLSLNQSNYTKWCRANITNNKFAEEGKDYTRFVLEYESGVGCKNRCDYKLTAEFAKQLSMLSKSERGEQARQYFLACEKGLMIAMKRLHSQQNDLAPIVETLQTLSTSMAKVQSDLSNLQQEYLSQTQGQLTAITNLITATIPQPCKPPFTRWMDKALKKVDTIAAATGSIRRQMLHTLYNELQDAYGIDLDEYQYEFCCHHGVPNTGIYTLNTIGADQELKKLFDLMLDTYIEQYCPDTDTEKPAAIA